MENIETRFYENEKRIMMYWGVTTDDLRCILPIFPVLDVFAREKARLEKLGLRLDDFDLLIGATAIHYDLILVTNNVMYFERMQNLSIENWTT